MIDLMPMKGIHVDPRARVARAQGGVLWSQFNRETQVHGLATTGVVGSTGIAGLTLGGGLGWFDAEVRSGARLPAIGRDPDCGAPRIASFARELRRGRREEDSTSGQPPEV
jgi:hypothetical protein